MLEFMIMGDSDYILPPSDEDDIKGAQRVFEDFFTLYQPTLSRVDNYLENIEEQVGPLYAQAYKPWQIALHDLCTGIYLVTKKIPLPDKDKFMEALKIFSFDGAIQFLYDLCASCRITLDSNWLKRFQQHINLLLMSISILNRQQQAARSL
jgi:hypothetical protein